MTHQAGVRKQHHPTLGVAFEYAIHDAVGRAEPAVIERISDALKLYRIEKGDPSSILYAIEKDGAKQLIDTRRELITPDSQVMSGKRGRPVKLHKHLNQLAAAFRRRGTSPALPRSIQGLWKADLFLGSPEQEHWVGTTIKIRAGRLESAAGLRIAIVPADAQKSDLVTMDEQKLLVVCPVPHDYSFMQTFHEGMRIIQVLCANDFTAPRNADLPSPQHREVARTYIERRDFTVLEVLDSMKTFAQPRLLRASTEELSSDSFDGEADANTTTMVGPIPLLRTDA